MSLSTKIGSAKPNEELSESTSELPVGTLQKTKNGNTWVVDYVDDKKVWVPYKTKNEREKIYEVHFNMSRPYTVRMTDKNAIIYDNKTKSNHAFYVADYQQVFVGSGLYQFKKELNKKVLTFPDSAKGNSILIQVKKRDLQNGREIADKYPYIFVGENIFTFFTNEPIIDLKSPIVGADVPYPSAETENDVYLLMHNEPYKIRKDQIPQDVEHVYDWFYGLPKNDKKKLKKYKIKIN